MFLATTSNRAFWDIEDELLFLGPWCTRYDRRHEWEGLKYRMLPNPWDDRKRLDEAISYIFRVQNHFVHELGLYLNKTHHVSHSSRYWRILLGPWLNFYTQTLYSRYVHIRMALDLFQNIRTLSLASECWTTPFDTSESTELLNTDRYNLQLSSQVLRALDRGTPAQSATFPEFDHTQSQLSVRVNRGLKRITADLIRKGLCKIGPYGRADIVLCDLDFSIRDVWAILKATGFRARLSTETLSAQACGERRASLQRPSLGGLNGRDEFERLLIGTLPDNFPSLFLEGYESARTTSLASWKTLPRVLVSSVGWIWNEYFKLLAAECSERGGRLIGIQHGGGYGMWRTLTSEVLELAICDRWYAWGWSSLAGDQKIRDLPSPHLSRLQRISSDPETKQILYVGTLKPLFLGLIAHWPMEAQYEQYLAWQIQFIAGLPDRLANRLLVRMYPGDEGWNEARRLKDAVPYVRFDDFSHTFVKQLRHVQFVVFDHPGTSALEAFVSGLPCLLFWNPRHWEFRPSALPYLDRLREAGILFDDPSSASAQLLRVCEDPEEWWRSESVRKAREAFTERFALNSPNWLDTWIRELRAEAAFSSVGIQGS